MDKQFAEPNGFFYEQNMNRQLFINDFKGRLPKFVLTTIFEYEEIGVDAIKLLTEMYAASIVMKRKPARRRKQVKELIKYLHHIGCIDLQDEVIKIKKDFVPSNQR